VEAWLADPDQGRRAEIDAVSGCDAVASALERMGPTTPELEAVITRESISDQHLCWAEVTRRGPDARGAGADETCLIGTTADHTGAVGRLVLFRAPAAPQAAHAPSGAPAGATPAVADTAGMTPAVADTAGVTPAARPIVERYFDDLMNSRFEAAAGRFTADTIYSHPPYRSGADWVLFRGQDALLDGWLKLRGPSPARQLVTGVWQVDDRFFIEGVVEGIPAGGSFFSTGQLNPQGEIVRYVAFYSSRRIPSFSLPSDP
jgi:hypothetical protein